ESPDGFEGVKTSWSLKSVLLAWFRAILVLVALFGLPLAFIGATEYARGHKIAGLKIALLFSAWELVCLLPYWLSIHFARARFDCARELGEQLGIPQDLIDELYPLKPSMESGETGPPAFPPSQDIDYSN